MDSSLSLHGAITFIMSFFPSFCQPKRKIAPISKESHNNDDESCSLDDDDDDDDDYFY